MSTIINHILHTLSQHISIPKVFSAHHSSMSSEANPIMTTSATPTTPQVRLYHTPASDTEDRAEQDDLEGLMNSSFDVSLISDTSTNSEDEELSELPISLMHDDFNSPLQHPAQYISSFRNGLSSDFSGIFPETMRSRKPALVNHGLGITGLSRKDKFEGKFDGLGLVGVKQSRRLWRLDFESIEEQDEENEQWESMDVSPDLSEQFRREAMYTWLNDPLHGRPLASIPEADCEGEFDLPTPLPGTFKLDHDAHQNGIGKQEGSQDGQSKLVEHNPPTVPERPTIEAEPRTEPRRATLTRDLSSATISSGLKRSASYSAHSTRSPSFSPVSDKGRSLSSSSARISSKHTSPLPSIKYHFIRSLSRPLHQFSTPRSLTPALRMIRTDSASDSSKLPVSSRIDVMQPAREEAGNATGSHHAKSFSTSALSRLLPSERGWRI